jgi:uncharacterized protein
MAMNGSLGMAVVIGLAFGTALEQAGLGNARKLVGQFYLTDFSVFKVMFSAILTTLLGSFWLARLGFIHLESFYVPETFVLPQLVGGLIFGIGFVLSGLCPGTSCVAAATGRGDGLATMAGMFAGIGVCGVLFDRLQPFYASTAYGPLTLPGLLDLPYGVVVSIIVAIALIAFRLLGRIEKAS